ncbi:MAG TPA: serine hydrolase [Candidatus Methylomirabilis sp.]|nr:serine hydrolase [Candidatus Methylomirabilis sp.]
MSFELGPLAAKPEVKAILDLLAAWIESQRAYSGLPSLSIGIVHDQEMVWAASFGWADPEHRVAATPDTRYRIASITKLFTATAILQLRDAGRLQLDDPITRHLPWFSISSRHAGTPPITVRHLITHTSGLPREAAFPYWTDGDFPTADRLREGLGRQEATLPTETQWKYSNLALALAGDVVVAVSGEPYPDYVRSHILGPLGMSGTLVGAPEPGEPRLARGFGRRLPDGSRAAAPPTDTRAITAAANMSSSVSDLARFAMLQFRDGPAGGTQILRGSTLREMQRVHWLEPDWQAGWGLGFRITRTDGRTLVGHGGALRGYRTQILLCPAEKLGVIVLTSADDGNPIQFAERAFQWVAPVVARGVARDEVRAPDPSWQRYTGRYRSAWGDAQVLLGPDGLVLIQPNLLDPLPTSTRLVPVGEHVFRAEEQDGYGVHGESVVFELDADGRPRRMRRGENYLEAVDGW